MSDPVTDDDLALYVDGQLDASRRLEVERHLARHPDMAATVIDEMRITHELRMSMSEVDEAVQPASADLARRLQGALGRRAWFERMRPGIAAACFTMIGVLAGGLGTAMLTRAPVMPDYVEAALRAHEVTRVRAVMQSQPEAPDYDRDELLSATAIIMPSLSADWIVRDVQVYPSRFGPSVEMALEAPELGDISIFAVRPGGFDVLTPTVTSYEGTTLAHWQIGEIAYAIVGSSPETDILKAAEELAQTLY